MKCLSFILLLVVLLSCGKKPSTSEASEDNFREENSSNETLEFYNEVRELDITCGEEKCPDSLYFIASKNFVNGKLSYCPGLQVKKGKVLVSAGCLPSNLIKEGKSCRGFVVARNEKNQKISECSEVEVVYQEKGSLDDPETWRYDQVLLTFDDLSSEKTAKINKKGFQSGIVYPVWFFDKISKNAFSLIFTKCRALFRNFIQPLGMFKMSPSISLSNCDSNTGALLKGALVQSEGFNTSSFAGIIYETFRQEYFSTIKVEQNFRGALYAHNLACNKGLNDLAPQLCFHKLSLQSLRKLRAEQLMIDLKSSLFRRHLRRVEESFIEEDRFIYWATHYEKIGDNVSFYPLPRCFKNVHEWIDEFKERCTFRTCYKKEHDYQINWKEFQLAPTLNNYGDIQHSLYEKESTLYELNFSPRSLEKNSLSDLTLKIGSQPSRIEEDFKNCSDPVSSL